MSAALLQEIAIALRHSLPLVPSDIRQEIEAIQARIEAVGPDMSAEQLREELRAIGKREWPYRRAFASVMAQMGAGKELEAFLEECTPQVRAKVEGLGVRDVPFVEWCRSRVVEEGLSTDERMEVERAWELAREHTRAYVLEQVGEGGAWHEAYGAALAKEHADQQALEERLATMAKLIEVDEHWGPEIRAQWEAFEDGWSVTERDAEPAQVAHALEEWQRLLTVGD